MTIPPLKFTAAESAAAYRDWKATCGPHALAAAAFRSLDEVRLVMVNYRGWMSPTHIESALRNLQVPYVRQKGMRTCELPGVRGIARVQYEGPWLNPGVPPAAAYHHTHYVAIWDQCIYCTAVGHSPLNDHAGWYPGNLWRQLFATDVAESGDAGWHFTHWWEI